jgi:serine/threonine protein kinase
MDPALASGTSPKSVVFHDGLGERRRISDVSGAETIEQLCLRGELTAIPSFEFALRERASRLANFRHVYYGRVRSVDRLSDPGSTLAVVSDSIKGVRLANLLAASQRRPLTLDINASLHLMRQLVAAVAMLHENARDVAHGAIGPERIIVTPNARIVIVEYVLGAALEQLHFSRERYWKELRIALPPSPALQHFDHRADVTQIGVVALSLVLGRLLHDDEYPEGAGDVLELASAISAKGEHTPLPQGIRTWISRALQLDPRHSFATALEARDELDRVLAGEDDSDEDVAESSVLSSGRADATAISQAAVFAEADEELEETDSPSVEHGHASEPAPASVSSGWSEPAPIYVPPASTSTPTYTPPLSVGGWRVEPADPPAKSHDATPPPTPTPIRSQDTHMPSVFDTSAFAAPAASSYSSPAAPVSSFGHDDEEDEDDRDHDTHETHAGLTARKLPMPQIAAAVAALIVVSTVGVFGARKFFTAAPAAGASGTLNINSNPPGAQVVVDGQASGVTPLTLTLKAGPHNVELRGAGDPRTIPVTITAGTQVSQYIELPKTTAFGQLQVRTEPAGAQVTVDGIPRGKAPVLVEALAAGEHAVVIENDGANIKHAVSVEAGMTASLVVPLTTVEAAPASGWITVSAPVELQLYENRRLLGTSQSDRLMLTAGKHEIEMINEAVGYRASRTVQVPAGKTTPIRLEWPKGNIAINALPWADVWIDGERIGETPIGNLSLPVGPHEIVFRHPDLGEQKYATTVSLRETARVSVDLRKK